MVHIGSGESLYEGIGALVVDRHTVKLPTGFKISLVEFDNEAESVISLVARDTESAALAVQTGVERLRNDTSVILP